MMIKPNQPNCALKIVFLLYVIISSSCGADTIKLNQIPPPPNSEKGIKYPEFNTQIDLATNFIVDDFNKKTGNANTVFYTLIQPTDWNKIIEFYDAKVKKLSFARVSDVPPQDERAKAVFYERNGFLDKQSIVVSLIEAKNYQNQTASSKNTDKYQFLMIATNTK